MANEIQAQFQHGLTLYALIYGLSFNTGKVANTVTQAFENYATANRANYAVSLTEQGTASGFYAGNFPAWITPGSYSVVVFQQRGGTPSENDLPQVAAGNVEWNGSYPLPLSDMATSGQLGMTTPIKMYRGEMVQNFPFYLVSAADHVTPFTSGVCSGQICRDPMSGGVFGPLQSGQFNEIGLGGYSLLALTSGDMLANTVMLSITAVGISGGRSDPRNFVFVLQKTSGGA